MAENKWIIKVTKKNGQDVKPYIYGLDKRDAEKVLSYGFISGEVLYKPE
jgi:hypothetical protein